MSHLRAYVSSEEADVMSKRQIVFAGQDAECRMSCTDTVSLGLMRAPIAESGEDADRGAVQWTVLLGYNDPIPCGPLLGRSRSCSMVGNG